MLGHTSRCLSWTWQGRSSPASTTSLTPTGRAMALKRGGYAATPSESRLTQRCAAYDTRTLSSARRPLESTTLRGDDRCVETSRMARTASRSPGNCADTLPGMNRFEAQALTHMLVVADADASRDWYVDVLGASVYGEYAGTSVVLDLMGSWLLLVTGGGPSPDKPTVTLAAPDDPDRVSAQMIFRVDDCRGAHRLLSERGAEFLTAPVDRGGEIRAFFRDPDGHLFEISELT